MKKIVYSAIVGALLLGSLTAVASAATNSLIGKKVQNVIGVTVNGKSVKDAVIIDGTTYAPVRSFSEAAGYSLTIEGGTVKMASSDTQSEDPIAKELQTKYKIDTLQRNISTWKVMIEGHNETVKQSESFIAETKAWNEKAGKDDPKLDTSGAEEKLKKAQADIAELQAKIDAANAEIEQLQAELK
ncbi:hypothetical protein [Paenibacillus lutimineralis]|uniref:Uncharacterized protein n=1 Tax=Paenibacillus lutimineralis TaxID=2707005 RepID=A0A3Q9IBW1_9BACL|nr:hypothetical protein [Paenibacillus lutimineralis]AZS17381.1 hypothetical protein EI981_25145 [Paenibacillus lutimineralis]